MKYAITALMLGVLLCCTAAWAEKTCPCGSAGIVTEPELEEKTGGTAQKNQPEKKPVKPVAGAAPAIPDPNNATKEAEPLLADISRARLILGPTVMERIPGQWSISIHELQIIETQYTIGRYLQAGAIVFLPVLGLGGMGTLRFGKNVSQHVALGVGGFGGGISTIGSKIATESWWMAGGHAAISMFPERDTVLTIGLIAAAVGKDGIFDNVKFVPVPYMGLITPISPSWSFVGEVMFPVTRFGGVSDFSYANDDLFGTHFTYDVENPFLFYYGFRFSTEWFYGDLGFFMPMNAAMIGLLMYCPLGLPYASVGIRM